MLTSQEVLDQKFAATKFREGYDQDEVDDFLDRVMLTLQALERGETAARAVTAQEVSTITFRSTKFREGYDQQEVDRFLDVVREHLTSQAPAEPLPWQPTAPLAADVTAVSATALAVRVQMAYSTRPPGAPDVVTVHLPDGSVRSVVDVRSTPSGIELVLG